MERALTWMVEIEQGEMVLWWIWPGNKRASCAS